MTLTFLAWWMFMLVTDEKTEKRTDLDRSEEFLFWLFGLRCQGGEKSELKKKKKNQKILLLGLFSFHSQYSISLCYLCISFATFYIIQNQCQILLFPGIWFKVSFLKSIEKAVIWNICMRISFVMNLLP